MPLLIEHATSPLELGYLTSVEADGGELFGTVALSAEANVLIEKSGDCLSTYEDGKGPTWISKRVECKGLSSSIMRTK